MTGASGSGRPCGAEVPRADLSSYPSRSTFVLVAVAFRGCESHRMCQLVDQPERLIDQLTHLAASSRSSPERSPTVSVDQMNAPRRPTAPRVAALPHGHQVAMRPSRPHRHLMAAVRVSARLEANAGRQWSAGPALGPLRQPGPFWLPLCGVSPRGSAPGTAPIQPPTATHSGRPRGNTAEMVVLFWVMSRVDLHHES